MLPEQMYLCSEQMHIVMHKLKLVMHVFTFSTAHASVHFAQAPLDVMPELCASPGKVRVDVCLWVVPLKMPQLH